MSSTHKAKPSLSSTKKDAFKSVITTNRKNYCEVEKHIICYLSKNRSSELSLVNRGANGSESGNNVRVIYEHPYRAVNISGIDNHEIMSPPSNYRWS